MPLFFAAALCLSIAVDAALNICGNPARRQVTWASQSLTPNLDAQSPWFRRGGCDSFRVCEPYSGLQD